MDSTIEQVCKQLAKAGGSRGTEVLPSNASTKRSMALVKVRAGDKKDGGPETADVFRAHTIDVTAILLPSFITA
jgi:acetolactate synthase small subunit